LIIELDDNRNGGFVMMRLHKTIKIKNQFLQITLPEIDHGLPILKMSRGY
jgi:hypothetical protein